MVYGLNRASLDLAACFPSGARLSTQPSGSLFDSSGFACILHAPPGRPSMHAGVESAGEEGQNSWEGWAKETAGGQSNATESGKKRNALCLSISYWVS